MFDILGWFVVAFLAFGAFATVMMVGRPRGPIESWTAAIAVVINLVFIWIVYGLIQGW